MIISFGEQQERVCPISPSSSAFVSCLGTLGNGFLGLRPHVPHSSERALRAQLLVAGLYAPGVGVAREIVSLPAPRILRIYDVDTGVSAIRVVDEAPTMILSMDSASVSSIERFFISGCMVEMAVRQFIDCLDLAAVSTVISLRKVGDQGTLRHVRIDYGVDASASNEYLGTSPWLTTRHYKLGPCFCRQDGFSVTMLTEQRVLRYDVQTHATPVSSSHVVTWGSEHGCCAASVTFDFSKTDTQQLSTHWRICLEPEKADPLAVQPTRDPASSEADHRARWKKIWEDHDVAIDANGHPIELGIRYAVFQLLQQGFYSQVIEPGLISPARGLSSTYHSGATFFDTELHKLEFWLWNRPEVARAFIDYRYRTLKRAIEFARSTGFAGARFPEASNDFGMENGPRYVLMYPGNGVIREWSVDEVLHISADVSYAVARYWTVTGDEYYMQTTGYALILECARFAVSAFKWSDEKNAYVIDSVMGPDEYHYHVSNSFFTNYMLRWCIQYALFLAGRECFSNICFGEVEEWHKVSQKVYLPWMTVEGVSIPEEFDGYAGLGETRLRTRQMQGPQFADETERVAAGNLQNFSSKVIKQADIVLLMSMFPDDFSDHVKRVAFNFYEPRTVHESSLSYGPHARVAADIGELEKSVEFISRASRYNLDFVPSDEYDNGLHFSAYAGAWQGLVEGLAGLRVDDGGLSLRPKLPLGWQGYRFVVCFRGKRLVISIRKKGVVDVTVDGRKLSLAPSANGRFHIRGMK